MTGVLQRLIGRATGELSAGLRPRLPSRFESGTRETGMQEIHAEDTAPRAAAPPDQPDSNAEHVSSSSKSLAAKRPVAEQAPAPLQAPRTCRPESQPIADTPVTAEDTSRLVSTPSSSPAPLLPTASPTSTGSPVTALAPDTRSNHPTLGDAPQQQPERHDPLQAAPPPLLPLDPTPPFADAVSEAARGQPIPPANPQKAVLEKASAPEITIHIGQLDIRTEQPKPTGAPARRAGRPRQMPALSDYLRGGS